MRHPDKRHHAPSRRLRLTVLLCLGALAGSGGAQTSGGLLYVSTDGNDGNTGLAPATALKTLAKALALADAQGGGKIRMTRGSFDGPALSLPANVTVEGNWEPGFAKQDPFTAQRLLAIKIDQDLCAAYTCLSANNADRVITLHRPGTTLEQLVVLGPDRSKAAGSSSYGVIVDGHDARLNHIVLKAGNGGPGTPGNQGTPGQGYCSSGGSGGSADYSQGGTSDTYYCRVNEAAPGKPSRLGDRVANGGSAGGAGATGCRWLPSIQYISDGINGGPGDTGIEGQPAAAIAPTNGSFARTGDQLHWAIPPTGPRGGSGTDGGGGGGGGAGGSWNTYLFWCVWNDTLGLVLGGPGHQGNQGGCPGTGGESGGSGGGAFALVVNDATVRADNIVLFGGNGGVGGVGGNGNIGAAGESTANSGGTGTERSCASQVERGGKGGAGGNGGKGGGGGGGAGGNGGPSIALAAVGTARLEMVTPAQSGGVFRTEGGAPGQGGIGGQGADSRTVAPTGNKAAVEKTVAFPGVASPSHATVDDIKTTASSSTPESPAHFAVDNDAKTLWNAGQGAPAWIELDLKATVTVRKLRLRVAQSPDGDTTHIVYFGATPAPTAEVSTRSTITRSGQWIELEFPAGTAPGRYLRIHTTRSPSWVAWHEIEVLQ